MYVVYLTSYQGNHLPPFYIGYTSESKIIKGYNGTVSSKKYKAVWLQERRDNPHLFKTEVLSHHATDTEALIREEALHRFYDVANNPSFINMCIGRGKFGGSGENNPSFGKHLTLERRLQIGANLKGKPRPDLVERNKKGLTTQTRDKIAESQRGKKRAPFTNDHKNKIHLGNIGKHTKYQFPPEELIEMQQAYQEAKKGRKTAPRGFVTSLAISTGIPRKIMYSILNSRKVHQPLLPSIHSYHNDP